MFIVTLFMIAKTCKQSECPSTDEWIKMGYMYTMQYYSVIKIILKMPFSGIWMGQNIIILSEISQIEKDKYRYHS